MVPVIPASDPAPRRDLAELLRRRYGPDAPRALDHDVVRLLLAHRSVRSFTDDPVGDDVVSTLVACAQAASTSGNFQLTSVVDVREPDRRARLAELAGGQDAVRDAGAFLVWVADWARSVDVATAHGLPSDGVAFLDNTLSSVLDVALAAQNAVVAAEALGFGVVLVGGLRNRVDEVCAELALPPLTFPLFGMAVGVPDPEDPADVKPRLPQEVVLHRDAYESAPAGPVADYRARIGQYYESQERPADWVLDRLAWRIAGADGMDGRETSRSSWAAQGFPLT